MASGENSPGLVAQVVKEILLWFSAGRCSWKKPSDGLMFSVSKGGHVSVRLSAVAPHFIFWSFDIALAAAAMLYPDSGFILMWLAAVLLVSGIAFYAWNWWQSRAAHNVERQRGARLGDISVKAGDHNLIGRIGHRIGGAQTPTVDDHERKES